jgi:glycosyltransferase involved in cell wall biosynthesis
VARASGWIERRTVSRAAMISTISNGLARELTARFSQPVFVCYNGYLPAPPGSEPGDAADDGLLRLVHTGLLYRDRRDPEPLLRALGELRRRSPRRAERIRAEFYGVIEPWFIERVKAHGLEDLVRIPGRVPFIESIRAQKRAAALLFFDWAGNEVEGVVSGKLFEYLGSGRPILVVGGRENSEAADIVARCRAGWRLRDSASIANWLDHMRDEDLRAWSPEPQAIAEFSRVHQAERLLEEIARRLALRATPSQ